MKAVLISIRPHWCEMIARGEKTIEVRKTKPKLDTPFKVYIYCTKDKHGWFDFGKKERLDGKVIGEFVCDAFVVDKTFGHDAMFNAAACMTDAEVSAYCLNAEMYGWHISDLAIYDKPKDLCEFYKAGTLNASDWEYQLYDGSGDPSRRSYASYLFTRAIRKPPQSWCYVEEL